MSLTDVYVVFDEAKTLGIIRRLLHPKISHCYVVWSDKGRLFKYDVSVDEVEICESLRVSGIILSVKVHQTEGSIMCLNTCVSSVKRFIGLRGRFIVTPYQLYKRLSHGITK